MTGILAVDDNPTSLRLLESMLGHGNYDIATAVNGINEPNCPPNPPPDAASAA